MRKSCIMYAEWADQILNLPPEEAGQYGQAILKYAIYGEKTETDNPVLNAMMVPVYKRVDQDAAAWEETKKQRSEAGKKGMAKRWHNGVITNDNNDITNDNSVTEAITPITVNVNENVNVNDKYIKKKRSVHDFPERTYDFEKLKAETNVR